MDKRPDQRTENQSGQRSRPVHDDAVAFSMKIGGAQNDAEQLQQPETPATPTPPAAPSSLVHAPPPLTPAPQVAPTPYPQGQQYPQYPQFAPYPPPGYAPMPQPGTPAYGQPYGPGMPSYPSQPLIPTAMPGTMPSAMIVLAPPPERKRGPLGRPFPLPLTALIFLGSIVLLALVFAVRVLALGGDWSEGAATVGAVAWALALVALLVALVRVAAGRRSLGFAALTLVLLVALTGTGIVGLAGSGSLHQVQAKSLETSGQWSAAIHEYGLTGQTGPNAPDIARVHDAWGEQLLQQQDYQGALTHFQTVLDDYAQSGVAVPRAQKGQFVTFATWLKNDPAHVPYRDAITAFTNFASNTGCDSACKTMLAQAAPQAYYLYGVQLLKSKRYALALAEFGKLAAQYRSSSYAKQAHTQAAAAYLAYGQQQIGNQDCTGAVNSYKTLVANYKDTPEATRAQTALAAPQDVTGFLTNAPTNPSPTVHLSKQMNFSAFYFSDEYSTSIDTRTGQFTFKLVAQGTYYLSTSRPVSGGVDYSAWWADSAHTAYFSFSVTPLCTVQLGNFPMK